MSQFKSERSLIEAVNGLKFEIKRDKAIEDNIFMEYRRASKAQKIKSFA